MLKTLKEILQQALAGSSGQNSGREHTLEMCAAVLMLEIALADSSVDAREQEIMLAAIRLHFHLEAGEADALLSLAREQVSDANSLHDFTRAVNEELSREEKTVLIELLWRVAAADSVVHKYEEYFIRKIADLLYVSHSDYIRAKHRAAPA
jgi:uncharacterized tellurite resistance protein B-like protein